jgi:FkbM family methyltransferase
MSVQDNRGILLPFKLLIGERAYRMLTLPASAVLRRVPVNLKYSLGLRQRRPKYPYKAINEGDTVLQVGAPRDLLMVGRSRTVYFLHLVGKSGKVVVFEPDPDSATALRAFAARTGLADRLVLVEKGAWSSDTTLTFYSSPLHPASNTVKGAFDIDETDLRRRGYNEIKIAVNSIDAELAALKCGRPKLISITANGSESEILKGMKAQIDGGLPYIALAITGENYPEMMAKLGYSLLAYDDRGYTFKKD